MLELILEELFSKFLVYFDRPAVRSQFNAVAIAVITSILITRVFILLINWIMPRLENRSDRQAKVLKWILFFAKWLALPAIGLGIFEIQLSSFTARGDLFGVIEKGIALFTLLFIYRLGLATLYALFDQQTIRRYHFRLIGPLFTLLILYQITSDFVRFPVLADIVLVENLDDPLTIGTLFLVIVGLYFWIDSVIGVGDIIQKLLGRFTSVPPGRIEGTFTLVRYLLIGVGLYYALTNLGLDSTTVAAITGGLSVGIGFGLKEVLSNFIGGLILLFEGSIQPGDILTLHNDRADVVKLGIRSTIISTDDETEIIVPNQELFTSQVIQRTGANDYIRTIIRVRASYKDDPQNVIAVLLDVCKNFDKLAPSYKAPKASIEQFGDYAIIYRLQVWSDHRVMGPIGIKLNLNPRIYEAFRENGIEMPYPQANIHLKQHALGENRKAL